MFKNVIAALALLISSALSAYAVDVNLAFDKTQVAPQETTRLRISLINPASGPATVSLTDLMSGIYVADVPNLTTTCQGSPAINLTNEASGGRFEILNAILPSNAVNNGTCSVSFDTVTRSRGTRDVVVEPNQLTGTDGTGAVTNPQRSIATLSTIFQNPTVQFSYIDGRYLSHGETAGLRLRISNPNGFQLSDLGFSLSRAALLTSTIGIVPGSATSTCGATMNAQSSGLSMSGGTVPANGFCDVDFYVNVERSPQLPQNTANGRVTFPVGTLTSTEGATNDTAPEQRITTSAGIALEMLMNGQPTSNQNISIEPLTALTIRLVNNNVAPVPTSTLTNTLPNGMLFDGLVSNGCGGSIGGAGTSTVTWTGSVNGAPTTTRLSQEQFSCDIIVNVRAPSAGTYVNTIPAGNLSGFQFTATSATLNASAGTLGASLTARNTSGGTQASWGDAVIVNMEMSELSGSLPISNVRAKITGPSRGVRFDSILSDSCGGGSVEVTPGSDLNSDQVTYTGGNIPVGGACEVQLRYVSMPRATTNFSTNIDFSVQTGDLTYDVNGSSNTFGITLTGGFNRMITPFVTVSSFSPTEVGEGGVSRLSTTLSYTSTDANAAEAISFRGDLSNGLVIAESGVIANSCGGTLTAVPGESVYTLTGGALSGPGSCAVQVAVRTPLLADQQIQGSSTHLIPVSNLSDASPTFVGSVNNGLVDYERVSRNARSNSATLTWSERDILVTKEFSPTIVDGGAPSVATITIANTANNAIPLTGLSIRDDMSSTDLFISSPARFAATGCGALNANVQPNSQLAEFSNGSVSVGATCRISFNVYSDTGGNHINMINAGDVMTNEAVINASSASATLTVLRNVNVSKSYESPLIAVGEETDLRYVIVNSNTEALYGAPLTFLDNLGSGVQPISVSANTCQDMDVQLSGNDVRVSGGTVPASSQCGFSVRVRGAASGFFSSTIAAGEATFMTADGTETNNTVEASDVVRVYASPTITKEILSSDLTPQNVFFTGEEGVFRVSVDVDRDSAVVYNDLMAGKNIQPTTVNFATCDVTQYASVDEDVTITLLNDSSVAEQCVALIGFRSLEAGAFTNQIRDGLLYLKDENGVYGDSLPIADSNLVNGTVVQPLVIGTVIEEDQIVQGGDATVRVRLTNQNDTDVLLSRVTSALTSGLLYAEELTSECGFAIRNENDLVFHENGVIPAGATCEVSFLVNGDALGPQSITSRFSGSGDLAGFDDVDVIATSPAFTITKTAETPVIDTVGQTAVWSVEVENTGDTPLTFESFSDEITLFDGTVVENRVIGDVTQPILAGEVREIRVETDVTAEVFDSGASLRNVATASMETPYGFSEEQSDDAVVSLDRSPAVSVVKTVDEPSVPAAAISGDAFSWTVRVTNTGDVSLTDWSFSDSRVEASSVSLSSETTENGDDAFSPGEVLVYQVNDLISEEDLEAETIENVFTFTAEGAEIPSFDAVGTDTVSITPNTAPVTVADVFEADEFLAAVTVPVLDNDEDAQDNIDPATVVIVGAPEDGKTLSVEGEGVWSVRADGAISFTPESGFYGNPASISYVVSDDRGTLSEAANVSVSYPEVLAPVATNDVVIDAEPTTVITINVLDNDQFNDVPADVESVLVEGAKTFAVEGEGVWTVSDLGTISFAPEAGRTASPTLVSYTVSNLGGVRSEAAVITITNLVYAPVAGDDQVSGLETTATALVNVTLNDSDQDGELDLGSVLFVENGASELIVEGQGTWSTSSEGVVSFAPVAGFTADPTPVSYTIADNDGNRSAPASISLTFTPRAPQTQADLVLGQETNTSVSVDVLANDSDPDGALDPQSLVIIGAPDDGKTLIVPGEGTWTFDAAGVLTFAPENGFTASPAPVSYTVADNDGNVSAPAEVRVSYDAVMPIAVNDRVESLPTNAPVSVSVLANDADPDGALDVNSVLISSGGAFSKEIVVSGEGVWSVEDAGVVVFTPEAGFTSNPAPISYTVADNDANVSNSATITLIFSAQAPVALPDLVENAKTNTSVTVDVLANDEDPDGELDAQSVMIIGAPDDGKTLVVPGAGVWNVTSQGMITFTPEDGFTASPAPISYTVSDNDGNVSAPAEISVMFAAEAPVSVADLVKGAKTNERVTVDVLVNDTDPDGELDPQSLVIVGAPNDGKSLTIEGEGVWTVEAGVISFVPAQGFTANPTPISYTVSDNDGNVSAPAEINIVFTPEAPTASADLIENAVTNAPVSVPVLANDEDPDGSLDAASVVLVGAAGDGKVLTIADVGTWDVSPEGVVTFTPAEGFTASPEPVLYTVADNDGNVSEPAEIRISYDAQAPVALGDEVIGAKTGEAVSVDVLVNDQDPDGQIDPSSLMIVGAPDDGKALTIAGQGVWSVNENGVSAVIVFQPEAGFTADPDPIRYTVSDNDGNVSEPAEIYISFTPEAPIAMPDMVMDAVTGTVVRVDVLSNDVDPDGALDPLSVMIGDDKVLIVPGSGRWDVLEDGSISFTPETGVTASPAPITYTVADNDGNRSAPVEVRVDFVVTAPIAVDDEVSDAAFGTVVSISVLSNDEDPDGVINPESVRIIGADAEGKVLIVEGQGSWTVLVGGAIRFTPADGFFGEVTPIRYTVEDNDGNVSEPAQVTLSYAPPALPVLSDDAVTSSVPGAQVSVDVLANDEVGQLEIDRATVTLIGADGDGKTLIVSGQGVWSVSETGQVSFVPASGFFGDPDPVSYVIRDVSGEVSSPATITIDYDQVRKMDVELFVADITDVDADGQNTPGDVVSYGFRVRNDGNVPLENVRVRIPGLPDLSCDVVSVPVGETIELTCASASRKLSEEDARRGFLEVSAAFTADALGEVLSTGDDLRIEVRLPEAEALNIDVTKRAEVSGGVSLGQNVPYLIIVRNQSRENVAVVDVIDRLPAGLSYVSGTAKIGSETVSVEISGSDIIWDDVSIPVGGTVSLRLQAQITSFEAGVRNVALVTDEDDRNDVVASTQADVREDDTGVAIFDCATVIGRVFEDLNGNAYMDAGERGVGGVRVITARGTSIITDAHGRYSVPCADAPSSIGSNMILKLDTRTLPDGYDVSTENPKVIRLTAGKMSDASFGIRSAVPSASSAEAVVAQISVDHQAFSGTSPSAELMSGIRSVAASKQGVDVRFEIVYNRASNESREAAHARAAELVRQINRIRGLSASASVTK